MRSFINSFWPFLYRPFKSSTTQRRSRLQHGYCIGVSRRCAQATAGKGLAQGPYVAARAGVEPTTLQLKVIVSTKAPPRPTVVVVGYISTTERHSLEGPRVVNQCYLQWERPSHAVSSQTLFISVFLFYMDFTWIGLCNKNVIMTSSDAFLNLWYLEANYSLGGRVTRFPPAHSGTIVSPKPRGWGQPPWATGGRKETFVTS